MHVMKRLGSVWVMVAMAVALSCSDEEQDMKDPCSAWKDAALRYFLCNPALIVPPPADDVCIDDAQVAQRWPQYRSVRECADYLDSLIGTCDGLEVSREAYRVGDDTVVFDWIARTGRRPHCSCDPLPPDYPCSSLQPDETDID